MLPAISPQEAFERFSKGEARLVDIRETDEYTQEFVPGSRLIPLSILCGVLPVWANRFSGIGSFSLRAF